MPEIATPTTAAPAAAKPAPAPTSAAPAPSKPAVTPATAAKPAESTNDEGRTPADVESAFDRLESRYAPKAEPKEGDEAKAVKPVAADKKVVAEPGQKAVEKKEDRTIQDGPKVLREQLEKVNKERDELSKSIPQLKAKIAEFEAKGKDTTALTDQLTKEKQEKESLLAEIRMLKKEVSPDFKEKWDKPFERMVGRAMNDLQQMVVLGEINPDTNEQQTADRPAVWSDFQALYAMPPNKAIAASRKMFGPDASAVVEHYMTRLRDMDFDRSTALEEEKAKWKENETRDIAEQATRKEMFTKNKEKAQQDLMAQHPELYDDDPNDPEGNELLKLGREYMEQQPKTEEEMHRMYARNYLNAVSAPRLADRLEKAKAKIAELEAVIAEHSASGPGTTRRTTQGAPKGEEKDWAQEMREAAAS